MTSRVASKNGEHGETQTTDRVIGRETVRQAAE